MHDLPQATRDAVFGHIAKAVMEGITKEHRDAVLEASVKEVIKEWHFQNAVRDAVVHWAAQAASEMMQDKYWQDIIIQTIRDSFDELIKGLREALPHAFMEALAGSDGTYTRGPGLILKYFPKKRGAL